MNIMLGVLSSTFEIIKYIIKFKIDVANIVTDIADFNSGVIYLTYFEGILFLSGVNNS